LATVHLAKRYRAPAVPFARKYTSADVALLVEMDTLDRISLKDMWLSAPAGAGRDTVVYLDISVCTLSYNANHY
jgi:hypothetical protein